MRVRVPLSSVVPNLVSARTVTGETAEALSDGSSALTPGLLLQVQNDALIESLVPG